MSTPPPPTVFMISSIPPRPPSSLPLPPSAPPPSLPPLPRARAPHAPHKQLVANPKLDAAPVNLTELRKAGLTRACELTGTDPATVVESCFEVWRRARHDVEPYLFPGALETLATLKGRGFRLVAITNGNAQTDDIPCLKDLFEFCVLAEQASTRQQHNLSQAKTRT